MDFREDEEEFEETEDIDIPFSGRSYIQSSVNYSDQHSLTDSWFPKNSLRTYISGHSRMARYHLNVSTDPREKQLKEELIELREKIKDLEEMLISVVLTTYKKLFDLYRDHHLKKSKKKLYIYSLYWSLKHTGKFTTHEYVANIFTYSKNETCKAIKVVDKDLYRYNYHSQLPLENTPHACLDFYLDTLAIGEKFEIKKLFEKLSTLPEFSSHRPNSLLAGIIAVHTQIYDADVCSLLSVSETTIYQMAKKISLFLKNK